jgi:DNA-binding NtrC family response regulator
MQMGRILIVSDEPNLCRIVASNLRQDQHQIWEAPSIEEARRILAANDFDVVVAEQKMSEGDGLTVPKSAHEVDPTLAIILVAAVTSAELAGDRMRNHAFDYLTKPLQPEVVRATVYRAFERTRLLRENMLLKNVIERAHALTGNSEIEAGNLPLRHKQSVPGNDGAHAHALSIPFADSFDLNRVLETAEKELILRTLKCTGGAKAEAARRMGLSRSALAYKLSKYGIRSTT